MEGCFPPRFEFRRSTPAEVTRRDRHEKDVSAAQKEKAADPWFSEEDEDEIRPCGAEEKKKAWPLAGCRESAQEVGPFREKNVCSSSSRGQDNRFPASRRIRKRRDFLRIQGSRNRFVTPFLRFFWKSDDCFGGRLGVTVSRKVGKAVVRSRVKRKIREVYRQARHDLIRTLDVVVVARPKARYASFDQLMRQWKAFVQHLAKRAGR